MFGFSRFPGFSSCLPATAAILCLASPAALSQVVNDVQVPFTTTLNLTSPTGAAVAPDGTIYVAAGSKVYRIQPSSSVSGTSGGAASIGVQSATPLTPSGVTLRSTSAVAVDAAGHLYIADATGHQVIEMVSPETSSAAQVIAYKSGTEVPTALAVDAGGSLYVADATAHGIYKYAGGSSTQIPITGGLSPVGVAVDAAGNVYFADAASNTVYKFSAGATNVFLSTSTAWPFNFASAPQPVGMGFDPAGNFYLLLNNSGARAHLIETNPANPSNVWEVPTYFAGTGNGDTLGGATVGPDGNVYLTDSTTKSLIKLFYNNNPVSFGTLAAGTTSSTVTENYYFVSGELGLSAYQSMQGDDTSEFVQAGTNTCAFSQTAGTRCSIAFGVNYQSSTPGLRNGVFGLSDSNGDVIAAPAVGISQAGALALYAYPGALTAVAGPGTSTQVYEPQSLAVTGAGGTLFVSDEGNPASNYSNSSVYAYTNGTGTPRAVGYQGAFSSPTALAVDSRGDLYVAQYNGVLRMVPEPWTSAPQSVTFPGVTLDHPISLAFDPSGNLYIGDAGPSGMMASASSPGFIVKVPADGARPVVLNFTVSGQPIIFPQALAFDPQGNLFIADGGDGVNTTGAVDVAYASTLAAAGSSGSIAAVGLPFNGSNQLVSPSGLGIDAAGDLYVLDGFNQRILVTQLTYGAGGVPSVGSIGYLGGLGGKNNLIQSAVTASSMVLWPGADKITVADLGYTSGSGGGTPAKVFTLDATNANLTIASSTSSGAGSTFVNVVDVGNQAATFSSSSPGLIEFPSTGDFSLSGTGAAGTTLGPGVGNISAAQINYNGNGYSAQNAIFTLLGNTSDTYSNLGNEISVKASPGVPTGQITTSIDILKVTVTLENIGGGTLNVTNATVTTTASYFGGQFSFTSGNCIGANLTQNQSCQMVVQGVAGTANVAFLDNSQVPPSQSVGIGCFLICGGGGNENTNTTAVLGAPSSNTNRPGAPGAALGSSGNGSNSYFSLAPWEAGLPPAQPTQGSTETAPKANVKNKKGNK